MKEDLMKKLLVVLLLLIASASSQEAKSTGRILSSTAGRYVLGQISENAKDQFLFDTQTGRLWRLTVTDDSMKVLKEVPFVDINESFTPSPSAIEDARLKFVQFSKSRTHRQMIDQLAALRKTKPTMTNKEFFTLCQKQGASIDESIEAAKASIPKYGPFAEDSPK
jgi:hypothetical protein